MKHSYISILLLTSILLVLFGCKKEHIEYYEDNATIKNSFFTDGENGPIVGEYKVFRSNGEIKEIRNYKNGSLNGKSYWFWKNDTIYEKNFKNGKLDGVQIFNAYKVLKNLTAFDSIQHYNYSDGKFVPDIKKGSFTDPRDSISYKTISLGKQTWIAENIRYKAKGSFCFAGKDENCEKYGRLYTKKTAKEACPEGWEIPTDVELAGLVLYAQGLIDFKETKEKEGYSISPEVKSFVLKSSTEWNKPEWGGNDLIGFTMIPSGYYCPNGIGKGVKYDAWRGGFYSEKTQYSFGRGEVGVIWQQNENKLSMFAFTGNDKGGKLECGGNGTSIAISVRCIKR